MDVGVRQAGRFRSYNYVPTGVSREKSVKTMEESESGITLQELPNDDQDEAKKKEAKAKDLEEKEKKGTLISISCKPF